MRCRLAPMPIAALLWAASLAQAQGYAFTYQGRLTDNGQPATGAYDLSFSLYPSVGSLFPIAGPLAFDNVQVAGGLFTVKLDFGAQFHGEDRWLATSVRPGASSGSYTALSPRQELTPTPYAMSTAGLSLPMIETGATEAGLVPSALLTIRQDGTSNAIMARSASTGAAIRADAAASGPALHAVAPADGTCLKLEGGAIVVKGPNAPVVGYEVSPFGSSSDTLLLVHPMLNGHPDAIVLLTPCMGHVWATGAPVAPIPAYVGYDNDEQRWIIRSFSGNSFPIYSRYQIMIVHRE